MKVGMLGLILAAALPVFAQEIYEIQVHGYDTVAPRHTMVAAMLRKRIKY